ncbi:MAG: BolA/IbaG family iron-sulfur metabolism protein, partial [Akkermansiaceae bacterium]|nr:BolA/IbaG family iron-sulfur metabolism protein [Akkermansiaceae bacterium]
IVISARFAGLTPVKRQQQVLAPVTEWLTTGALHAFSVKTYTPEEWAQHQAATAAGLVPIQ